MSEYPPGPRVLEFSVTGRSPQQMHQRALDTATGFFGCEPADVDLAYDTAEYDSDLATRDGKLAITWRCGVQASLKNERR